MLIVVRQKLRLTVSNDGDLEIMFPETRDMGLEIESEKTLSSSLVPSPSKARRK